MNGDDERDYAEEAAVQRDIEVEGLAELEAERTGKDAGQPVDPYAHDYGPLQTFELIWTSGHVERIRAHQVTEPGNAPMLFGGGPPVDSIVMFHGSFDGHWRLVLRARLNDLQTIRNLTATEPEVLG